MGKWPAPKDPDDVKDYGFNWAAPPPDGPRLAEGETIVTSEWLHASGDGELTIDSDSHDDTTTTVWLSGGTLNTIYRLTNRVVTTGGRTMDWSCDLWIRAQ